jgi:uncharacterized membrane protein HdeD (DUF308 family)
MENAKKLLGQFISDTWWIVLLRGIMLLLFGILFQLNPGIALITVIAVLGAFWFVDGIFVVINSIIGHQYINGWGWGIFSGISGILAGSAVMFHPVAGTVFSQFFLVYFTGFAAIFKGVSEIYFGIILRKEIKNEWAYTLAGVISLLFGVFILMYTAADIIVLIWMTTILSMVGGILLIIRSYQLNKIGKELTEETAD